MELRAILRRDRIHPLQRPSGVDDANRFGDRVGDGAASVGSREIHPVRHRSTPVIAALKRGEPVPDPEQAADIGGVAVGIPAAGVDDHLAAVEVAIAVEQRVDDEGVVRHHVAGAAPFVVAIFRGDQFASLAPIRFGGVPGADVVDHRCDHRIGGDDAEPGVDQLVDVIFDKGLRLHRRDHLGAVDRFAVVADAGGAAGEIGRHFRIAGGDHRPAVDEDLRSDLLGNDLAVEWRRCR